MRGRFVFGIVLVVLSLEIVAFAGSENKNPPGEGLPLWYFRHPQFENFGDLLSLKIVERMVNAPVSVYKRKPKNNIPKLLAVGSVMHIAADGDVIWGSGVNGKDLNRNNYNFSNVSVRAVRGPLSREFLIRELGISVPEIYGDPALLLPYLFPEFKRSEKPSIPVLIIAHYSDADAFPKDKFPNVMYAWEPWDEIIRKVIDSEFVISSSLHGVVVAEAFGVPARLLRLSDKEPLLKFTDYYMGTNRPNYRYATTLEEALGMGGEEPFVCDLEKLYNAFPMEYWPSSEMKRVSLFK